jgi:hypothetical protein
MSYRRRAVKFGDDTKHLQWLRTVYSKNSEIGALIQAMHSITNYHLHYMIKFNANSRNTKDLLALLLKNSSW